MKKIYQTPYSKVIELHLTHGILAGSNRNDEVGYDEEFTRRRMWLDNEEEW